MKKNKIYDIYEIKNMRQIKKVLKKLTKEIKEDKNELTRNLKFVYASMVFLKGLNLMR